MCYLIWQPYNVVCVVQVIIPFESCMHIMEHACSYVHTKCGIVIVL